MQPHEHHAHEPMSSIPGNPGDTARAAGCVRWLGSSLRLGLGLGLGPGLLIYRIGNQSLHRRDRIALHRRGVCQQLGTALAQAVARFNVPGLSPLGDGSGREVRTVYSVCSGRAKGAANRMKDGHSRISEQKNRQHRLQRLRSHRPRSGLWHSDPESTAGDDWDPYLSPWPNPNRGGKARAGEGGSREA